MSWDGLPAEVVTGVQANISETLGLPVDQFEVATVEQVEWRDSCLELGGPAESCAAVITPGWRIVVSADGQDYEVRTDETGTQVRWVTAPASQ
jgi:hypothetical protein